MIVQHLQKVQGSEQSFLRAVQAMQYVICTYDAGRARASIPVANYDSVHPERSKIISEFEPVALCEDVDQMWKRYLAAKDEAQRKLFHTVYRMIEGQEKTILTN